MPARIITVPSVAPVSMAGTTGGPGQYLLVLAVTAAITLGSMGVWGVVTGWFISLRVILESASTCSSVRLMSAGLSTGSRRQLTTAVASWGSAFWAWPAESMVATQVVRSWALYKGMAERRAMAAASLGLWTMVLRSAPSCPP